jgi:hypothetical protein
MEQMDMMTEESISIQEETKSEAANADEPKKTFSMESFLKEMGLETPIDYLFHNFAIQKSRDAISKAKENFQFLFHLLTNSELDNEPRPFPRCCFLESGEWKMFDNDKGLTSTPLNVLWTFVPSEEWETREQLPFTDFHLYFIDVIKPNHHYSAEELYKIFDSKRGERYFLNSGTRADSDDRKYHILFITDKGIIVFHVPEIDITTIKEEEKFMSLWTSLKTPNILQYVKEFAYFELPSSYLVTSPSEISKMNEESSDVECKECQA